MAQKLKTIQQRVFCIFLRPYQRNIYDKITPVDFDMLGWFDPGDSIYEAGTGTSRMTFPKASNLMNLWDITNVPGDRYADYYRSALQFENPFLIEGEEEEMDFEGRVTLHTSNASTSGASSYVAGNVKAITEFNIIKDGKIIATAPKGITLDYKSSTVSFILPILGTGSGPSIVGRLYGTIAGTYSGLTSSAAPSPASDPSLNLDGSFSGSISGSIENAQIYRKGSYHVIYGKIKASPGTLKANVRSNSMGLQWFNEDMLYTEDVWLLHSTWTSFEKAKLIVRPLIDAFGMDSIMMTAYVPLDLELLPNK